MEQFTDQIRGGEFQMLFDSFEAYDVQETRRISKAEDVLELLTELGAVSEELRRTVMETKDLEKLKTWLKLAAKTESVEQFQRQGEIWRCGRRGKNESLDTPWKFIYNKIQMTCRGSEAHGSGSARQEI